MHTTQQHARGSARASTEHLTFMAPVLYHARWPILSLQPPPLPPMTRPSLISIGQSGPLYFSRKLQMFCSLHNCTQGRSTPFPSKTRGACTKLSRNIAMQMCQKVRRAILDHFMIVTLEPSRSGLVHGQRLSPASTYIHTRLHRRGQRPIRRVVQELPCNHWTTWYSNLP